MQKINFEDLPSTNTPINSTNLNQMQSNMEAVANETHIVETAGTDLNNYTTTGYYYFGSSYTPTNIPAGANGWLEVIRGANDNIVKQMWHRQGTIDTNDTQFYVRTKSGTNNWSNWQRLALVSEFNYYLAKSNVAVGRVSITPSAANTPTSKGVTWAEMGGTPRMTATFAGTVPGTQVLGVSVNNVSSTGANVWVTATNTSARAIDYIAIYN